MSLDPSIYRGVMTESEIADMCDRTNQRRKEAIKRLGSKWLGYAHPKPAALNSANVSRLPRKAAK